ncbi:hypothetical protein MRX96_016866 [Rhipicephalus microplus]
MLQALDANTLAALPNSAVSRLSAAAADGARPVRVYSNNCEGSPHRHALTAFPATGRSQPLFSSCGDGRWHRVRFFREYQANRRRRDRPGFSAHPRSPFGKSTGVLPTEETL